MKKIIVLILVLIMLVCSACTSSDPLKISEQNAKFLLNLHKNDVLDARIYNFDSNVLLIGKHKPNVENDIKIITFSVKNQRIVKEKIFKNVDKNNVFVFENEVAIFDKINNKAIFLDKELNETLSYPLNYEEDKVYKLNVENKAVYIFDKEKGVTKKSLETNEETIIYSGVILPYEQEKNDNFVFFYYYDEKAYSALTACFDISNETISYYDIPSGASAIEKCADVLIYDKYGTSYIKTEEKHFKSQTNNKIRLLNDNKNVFMYSSSLSRLYIYDYSGIAKSYLNFPKITTSGSVADMIYIKELESYLFLYSYRNYTPVLYLWTPDYSRDGENLMLLEEK